MDSCKFYCLIGESLISASCGSIVWLRIGELNFITTCQKQFYQKHCHDQKYADECNHKKANPRILLHTTHKIEQNSIESSLDKKTIQPFVQQAS